MFSAYDIKKIIPRAVFALVAINLSWSLMDIFMQTIDLMGDSIQSLIRAPFGSLNLNIQFGSLITLALGFIATSAGLGLIPVVGVLATGMIGILSAFAIVLLRRVALIGLVMFAPLAIAFGILPQTESWFKKWWEWFSRLSLMYPFIMAMFAVSQVAANILSNSTDGGITGLMLTIGAIGVLFAPYFLFGKALSFAGSTVGKLAGVVNNRNKGFIDKSKKWDQERVARNRVSGKAGDRFDGGSIRGRVFNRPIRRALNPKESLSMHPADRQAAAINAQEGALAALLKTHPELEKLSDDEAELLAMGSEQAAKGRIDDKVAKAIARGEDGAKVRRDLELALSTAKNKAGGFGSVAGQAAATQAIKAGRIASHEIDEVAERIATGAARAGSTQHQAIKDQIVGTFEAGYKESPQLLHSQFSQKDPATGARVGSAALSDVIGAENDVQRNAALGALSTSERIKLHTTVNGLFDGTGKVGLDKLGTMDAGSRGAAVASKQQQVQAVLTSLANGSISAQEAAAQLATHRADALTLAQTSTDAKNTAGAQAGTDLAASIDAAIAAHNNAVGPAPGLALNINDIADSSAAGFQGRMGGAGTRPTGP